MKLEREIFYANYSPMGFKQQEH